MWLGSRMDSFTEGQDHRAKTSKKLASHVVVSRFYDDSFRLLQGFIGHSCPGRWGGKTTQGQIRSLKRMHIPGVFTCIINYSSNDPGTYVSI